MRPYLAVYGLGQKMGATSLGAWFQKIGEPPVFYDSIEQIKSAQQLGLHYFNLGYYRAETTSWAKHKGRKTTVFYDVYSGPRFTIKEYQLRSTDRFIDSALTHFEGSLYPGDPVVADQIEIEQLALMNFLKSKGYYHAQTPWVYFEVDTTLSPHQTVLTAVVDPYIVGADSRRKRIQTLKLQPTYSYREHKKIIDSTRTEHGIDVLQTQYKFRPGFMDRQIFIGKGEFYNQTLVQETYKNLNQLGIFKSLEMDILDQDSILSLQIKGVPMPKRAFSAALEGMGNSGSLGLGGSASWDNRNLFGGGELLRLQAGGSISEQRNSTNSTWLIDSRELSAGATLNVPQFILPSALNPQNSKRWRPTTKINAQLSYQYRAQEFGRFSIASSVQYRWKRNQTQHTLTPASLNFVSLQFANDTLNTPFLFVGFQNLVFPTSSYRTSRSWNSRTTKYFTSAEIEFGGHLWKAFGLERVAETPVSNFTKTELDFRSFRNLAKHRVWATRTYLGTTFSNGSISPFVPFEKSFFMGGTGDLRGWTAYHFGPGATSEDLLGQSGFFSAAPIKFIHSTEVRFTVKDALKGAVFADMGNMWLWNQDYGNDLTPPQIAAVEKGIFHWHSAWKQLGLNIGYGIRYDVEFFILRADLGLKIHHPGAFERSNWVISEPKWKDLNLGLGIGYPF